MSSSKRKLEESLDCEDSKKRQAGTDTNTETNSYRSKCANAETKTHFNNNQIDGIDSSSIKHGHESSKKVWIFGVVPDPHARQNNRDHNRPSDFIERIQVPERKTLYELINFLCNSIVKDRRGSNCDYGIDQHMWELRIENKSSLTEVCITSNAPDMDTSFGDSKQVNEDYFVQDLKALEIEGKVVLKYDFGNRTIVNLNVLSVGESVDSNADICLINSISSKSTDKPRIPPIDPPTLSMGKDAVIISKSKALAAVTALAIAPVIDNDYPNLYSGHRDGKVCKWSLSTNTKLWETQVFTNMYEDETDEAWKPDIPLQYGIRGIAVNEIPSGEHVVYLWSNHFEPKMSSPNEVRILNGQDGTLSNVLVCEVDEMEVHPLISCIVFSKLKYNDEWEDATIVGLKASAETLENDEFYTDFDIEEAEDYAYGNILPFIGQEVEETWRGHSGIIRSMAVIPDEYIISCSEHQRHGFAERILLWSAREPGVPLHRINLFEEEQKPDLFSPNFFHPLTCLKGGISIYGNKILLGCEKGDMLVPIDVVTDVDRRPRLKMRGLAKLGQRYNLDASLKGCFVGSGDSAIINNQECEELWIFPISSLGQNPILDTDLSKRSSHDLEAFLYGDSDGLDSHDILLARSMAVGKLVFPTQEIITEGSTGAPEVFAMKGRWVVAGFACGSILKAALLPEDFKDESRGANLNASTFLHTDGYVTPHFDILDHPAPPQPECTIQ